MPIAPKSPTTQARRAGAPKAKGAVRAKSGCYTCRIRRKKCDEQPNAEGSCQTCVRLRLQCLGFGAKRPEWLRSSDKVVDLREKIKNFLAAQGMIKGHSGAGPRPTEQEPSILSLSGDYPSPSTSPQTPTLSISSDERHPGIPRNDYLRGDTDARLPVMQDIDSPLDPRDTYPGVILPAYSSTTYSSSLEPWPQSTPLNLPRPHTSDLSRMYNVNVYWDDEDPHAIPAGFGLPAPMTIPHNYFPLNHSQSASLDYYMKHVLRTQYLHADGSIDQLIWNLIHSSDTAREAACLLATFHHNSTRGDATNLAPPGDHDVYKRIQIQRVTKPVTEGDALASLCMVSYFLFSGGQGQWQAFLDSACHFCLTIFNDMRTSPAIVLMSCSDTLRFIIKTSMWFDVLASATLMRRPMFLSVIRSLYFPSNAFFDDGPASNFKQLSMMDVMGCENRIVLGLAEIADLAYWKAERQNEGNLSVPELVKRGKVIECMLSSGSSTQWNTSDYPDDTEPEILRHRRSLTSEVFRTSALVYLHSVISGDHPQCPEIVSGIENTVACLKRAEDVSTGRSVVRSVVFSICICGCLTDVEEHRRYFLRRLQEQQTETVGNCSRVSGLMKRVWEHRKRNQPVDWRVVMRESQMLLV